MNTISLCIIVKNEEDVLARCLTSAADLVDEIIIVDTGSTDRTKEIASGFTKHIYDFPWIDDFSAARNFSFSIATMDFCLWLDACDVLLENDRNTFRKLKEALTHNLSVVMMKYSRSLDEQDNHAFANYRERIVRNRAGMIWEGAVYEAIQPLGQVIHSECAVTCRKLRSSDPDRNLRIFEKQLKNGVALEPRQQFYFGLELYYHKRYEDALQVLKAFLDGGRGALENNIDACRHCAYCYYGLKQDGAALLSLFRTLELDLPRAKVCCDIGKHFLDRTRYAQAVFWYTLALSSKREDGHDGFTSPDCYGYLPCIQLCACYIQLGDSERAIRFNELAAGFKPDSEAAAHNRLFFAGRSGASPVAANPASR